MQLPVPLPWRRRLAITVAQYLLPIANCLRLTTSYYLRLEQQRRRLDDDDYYYKKNNNNNNRSNHKNKVHPSTA